MVSETNHTTVLLVAGSTRHSFCNGALASRLPVIAACLAYPEESMQNIYGAKQLAASFRTVRQNTIQVAEDIPEEKYSFIPAEGTRSVEQSLAHIAISTRMWQEAHASGVTKMHEYDWGNAFQELDAEEKKKHSKKELIDLLKNEGERFAKFLEGLSDEKLGEQITEDPKQPTKSRLEALMSAKEHEMHCRGQLMLVERMLGIVPHLTRKYAEMEREMREAAEKKKA
jgi:uncharacterized damage-inducible protein DinB